MPLAALKPKLTTTTSSLPRANCGRRNAACGIETVINVDCSQAKYIIAGGEMPLAALKHRSPLHRLQCHLTIAGGEMPLAALKLPAPKWQAGGWADCGRRNAACGIETIVIWSNHVHRHIAGGEMPLAALKREDYSAGDYIPTILRAEKCRLRH